MRKPYNLSINLITCAWCNEQVQTHRKKYCSDKCAHKADWDLCKKQHKERRKDRGTKRKEEAIRLKGGQCEQCGYNKCIRALTFHHIDSKEKKFTLDQRAMSQRTLEEIMIEVNKCQLLCFNCHMEHHYNELH
jgi:hypothetical protein